MYPHIAVLLCLYKTFSLVARRRWISRHECQKRHNGVNERGLCEPHVHKMISNRTLAMFVFVASPVQQTAYFIAHLLERLVPLAAFLPRVVVPSNHTTLRKHTHPTHYRHWVYFAPHSPIRLDKSQVQIQSRTIVLRCTVHAARTCDCAQNTPNPHC